MILSKEIRKYLICAFTGLNKTLSCSFHIFKKQKERGRMKRTELTLYQIDGYLPRSPLHTHTHVALH